MRDHVFQSGCIPYRIKKGAIEILLVTAKSNGMWIIPKGHLEEGMSVAESAAAEAFEEAGVEGRVSKKSHGVFSYEKNDRAYVVEVFILKVKKVLKNWQEERERRREWVSLEEALSRLTDSQLKQIVKGLPAYIEKD